MSFQTKRSDRETQSGSALDSDVVEMSEIARRWRLDSDQDLERIFEKAKTILNRCPTSTFPIEDPALPAALKAKLTATASPEDRIRTIVQFKLSTRVQGISHH